MLAEARTVYFSNPGSENTDEVVRIAKQRAEELGIKTIVAASSRGNTAVKAVEACKGIRIIAVSSSTGYHEPNVQIFNEENRKIIEDNGGAVLTATHAFAGVSRALYLKFETAAITDVIANTLKIFSAGVKVACEIAMMAADSGLVRTDEEVISIAGTSRAGRGADTAIVLTPVNTHNFFDLRVKELLCKPRL